MDEVAPDDAQMAYLIVCVRCKLEAPKKPY